MLAENDFEVTVFIPAKQSQGRKIVKQQDNIRLVYFRQHNNAQNKFLGEEAALSYELSAVLKEFEDNEGSPDFIESQEYRGIAYYPLQRRLLEDNYLKNTKFFVTAHAPGFLYLDYNQAPSYQLPEYWIGEMEKSVLKTADFVISPSQYLLDELKQYMDLSGSVTEVLRNPFDSFEYEENFQKGDLVFFGKLTPQKGGLEMLQYFQELWDGGFKHSLRIIGGGDHFFYPKVMDMGKYVRNKFSRYIENGLLIFEGHIQPEKIQERLAKAHVVIVPSIVDNLPYTVLEAMSMGKIVLVSLQGGHAELIVHGENGYTFSHHDDQSFKNALQEIQSLTKEKVLEVGARARKTILEQCAYPVVLSKKLDILNKNIPKEKPQEFPFIRPRKKQVGTSLTGGEKGLLSIVIPFYNLGRYVEDCIKSISESDYIHKEIILINDGSTDSISVDALKELEKRYTLKVVHQKNQGLSQTRNNGAEIAKGEYLAFLDADDTVHPTYYSKAIGVLARYENISFVGCWAQYFEGNDDVWPAFNPEPPYLLAHNTMNSSAIVFRRESFRSIGGNDPLMIYGMEDYETVVNLVKNGFQGVVLPEILWNYRIRTGSMAQSFNRYSELYLYRLISRKHASFFGEYAEEVANLLNANGPGMNYKNPTVAISGFAKFFKGNSRLISFVRRNKILRKIAKSMVRTITKV